MSIYLLQQFRKTYSVILSQLVKCLHCCSQVQQDRLRNAEVDAALKIPDYSNLSLFWKNKNSKEASIRKEKGEKSVYTTSFFDRLAAVVNTCPKMKKLLNLGSKTASSSQSNRNFLSRGLKDHMPIDHHRYRIPFKCVETACYLT
ncbi:hypothetical protein TNIN_347191 [Trichonephila inaurata madagascariensis]|uniref:Uncharacterized protein n=1 Tax=Trichonephila inaurata madagascariensis TaxID=2747483 RepID=A0A8X6XLL0_9ARAC|nr:hypothetical protein TNIN_347191 [Trichonephila inaurata madagascariensis]